MQQIEFITEDTGYRVTVGPCDSLDTGEYQLEQMEGVVFFEAETGILWSDYTQDTEAVLSEMNTRHYAVFRRIFARAAMLASMKTFEVLDVESDTWTASPLPTEWMGCEGFFKHVPTALFEPWLTASHGENVGLFPFSGTADPKAPPRPVATVKSVS